MVYKYYYAEALGHAFPEFLDSVTFDKYCDLKDNIPEEMFAIGQIYMAFLNFTVKEVLLPGNKEMAKKIFKWIEDNLNSEIGSEEDEHTPEFGVRAALEAFLENLINKASHDTLGYSLFVPLLGPKSQIICKEWDIFTGARTPGLWSDEDWEVAQDEL